MPGSNVEHSAQFEVTVDLVWIVQEDFLEEVAGVREVGGSSR